MKLCNVVKKGCVKDSHAEFSFHFYVNEEIDASKKRQMCKTYIAK